MNVFLCRLVLAQWRLIVFILAPIALTPLLYNAGDAGRCAYVLILVALYWLVEVTDLAMTALMPVFLFPLLGIMSTKDVSVCYLTSTQMIFFGGISMALAVEHAGLHERIALFIIIKIGQSPERLIVGFMLTTMLLSMWVSNTATTAMMIPIVDAVVNELRAIDQKFSSASSEERSKGPLCLEQLDEAIESDRSPNDDVIQDRCTNDTKKDEGNDRTKFRKVLLLATAYSANIGGISTITGTNSNILLHGYVELEYRGRSGLNYATWMMFGVPTMLLTTLLAAMVMTSLVCDWKGYTLRILRVLKKSPTKTSSKKSTLAGEQAIRKVLIQRYKKLGSMKFHEIAVASMFTVLVILWFMRSPNFITGWGDYFDIKGEKMIAGATPAVFMVFLLTVIPANMKNFKLGEHNTNNCLLSWQVIRLKFPWEVLIIMGGGFALAKGSAKSGLSLWISEQMTVFGQLPSPAIAVLLVCIMTATLTEAMSNTAVVSIFLPVFKELAGVLQVNPLYIMLPAVFCCSYAFMLPVGTPPNTLAFSAGNMSISEMMRVGVFINIIAIAVVTLMINTLGDLIFDLHTYHDWANTTLRI